MFLGNPPEKKATSRFGRGGWQFNPHDYQPVPWSRETRANIPESIRQLVYASQFRNTEEFGKSFHCAYTFEVVNTGDCPMGIKKQKGAGGEQAEVDHIIPIKILGKNSIFNFQMLTEGWNQIKGALIVPQVIWFAFREGKSIKVNKSFHVVFEEMIEQFEELGHLECPWPWWAEEANGRPMFFGLDENTMRIDPRESFEIEREILKPNIIAFLEACEDDRIIDQVVATYEKIHKARL